MILFFTIPATLCCIAIYLLVKPVNEQDE